MRTTHLAAKVIDAKHGCGSNDKAFLLLVKEITLDAVLHARGRVQLAVDCVHGAPDNFHHMDLVRTIWRYLLSRRFFGNFAESSPRPIGQVNERERERETSMGNHMDKVMDGLYVGGFLGQ